MNTMQFLRKQRSTLILIITSLCIWFAGPYVAIAGHSILASVTHRLILIFLLAIIWVVKLKIHTKLFARLQTSPTTANYNFNETLAYARQHGRHILQKIPVCIVLGPSQAGKSTLLAQLSAQASPFASNKMYDAWLIDKILFIEIHEVDFIPILKKHQKRIELRSILTTVSLQQLSFKNRQEQQLEIQNLEKNICNLHILYPNAPIFCLFTQCDLIDGFTVFFDNLTLAERQQPWGMIFANIKNQLPQLFDAEFAKTLKRLNLDLIKRIHQEHTQTRRAKIYEFLLQLEMLKATIREIYLQQVQKLNLSLTGCYFTSALQYGTATDYLQKILTATLGPQRNTIQQKSSQSTNYFIGNLTQQLITRPVLAFRRSTVFFISTALAMTLILVSGFWYQSYRENRIIFNTLQSAIQNISNNNTAYSYLAKLDALQSVLKNHHAYSIWLTASGLPHAQHLLQTANIIYHKTLTEQFLPALQTIIEGKVQQAANTQNASELYGSLKVYLMLNSARDRDKEFIVQWFSQYWQQTDPKQQKSLLLHLSELLNDPSLNMPTNPALITNARAVLNQIPMDQLSFSILLDHYHTPLTLVNNNSILSIKDNYQIPVLYTNTNFNDIYNHEIRQACEEVVNGNWVLGEKNQSITSTDVNQLISNVQALYLQHYLNAWQQLLNNVSIKNITSVQQMTNALTELNNEHLLLHFLQLIQNNTVPNNNEQFNLIVAPQFQTLDMYTLNNANNLEVQISYLKNYFVKINNASDVNHAAWSAAVERLKNNGANDIIENLLQQATHLPAPAQTWVNQIAIQSWQVLLSSSQIYLNQIWAKEVLPEYNQYLDQRYPLFKTATMEISINDFAKFFGIGGTLDNFFNNYLKPFVDTSSFYWVWKNVDNQHIAIPATTLEMFIRASVIQKMFFTPGISKPLVKFALIPVSLEPGITDFNLNVDDQTVDYTSTHALTTHLIWTGTGKVILQFTKQDGKVAISRLDGPWSLFRLLDKSNLQTTPNPRLFKLTFDLNGNAAQYRLLAENIVNPFIPGIINVFRCPEKL